MKLGNPEYYNYIIYDKEILPVSIKDGIVISSRGIVISDDRKDTPAHEIIHTGRTHRQWPDRIHIVPFGMYYYYQNYKLFTFSKEDICYEEKKGRYRFFHTCLVDIEYEAPPRKHFIDANRHYVILRDMYGQSTLQYLDEVEVLESKI